jgi:hypothetical protein
MPQRTLDAEIDRLYQLPLEEFTAARNALAKEAGSAGSEIRKLTKPPVAAWAVNQVHWRNRPAYDALIEAADALRAAHSAVLAGKSADLRAAGRDHEQALEAALKAALEQLSGAGHPATDATRQAIATTLRGLPAGEAPGRLDRTLQPGGFEMLAGIPVRAPAAKDNRAARAGAAAAARTTEKPEKRAKPTAAEAKGIARARETLAAATRRLRAAEHTARREEFEAARAARDVEKATRSLAAARESLEAAQQAFEEAKTDLDKATRAREAAEKRAGEADRELEGAKKETDTAQQALDRFGR